MHLGIGLSSPVTIRPRSAIFLVITVNIILMACDYWGLEEDPEVLGVYSYLMLTLVHIYYVECVLKVIGLGTYTSRLCASP